MSEEPKFAKPKIFLVDIDEAVHDSLRDAGFNVSTGTLGSPRLVERSDNIFPVDHSWAKLDGFAEQEIVFVNSAQPTSVAEGFVESADGVTMLWQTADCGVLDARPLVGQGIREDFDRIMQNGGIAVVFLGARYERTYMEGVARGINFRDQNRFELSSWDFSSDLEAVRFKNGTGREVKWLEEGNDLSRLLRKGSEGAEYRTRIAPEYHQQERFVPLAKDKFDNVVASILLEDENKAALLLLPQMPNFHRIAVELVLNWFTKFRPALFPHHENQSWLRSDRYEMPSIIQKRDRLTKIKTEYECNVQTIENEISTIREANADWYTLLSGTGDPLVKAVINALRKLGFRDVIDMDDQARLKGTKTSLREDLQIRDRDPLLVVDIKGVVGTPEDGEATQAQKHSIIRTRELGHYVKPLTIINHQRNLPPHERHTEPYRSEIVGNALDTGLGLMTAWDLFCLLRNASRLGWSFEQVAPVFYRDGRIHPIPEYYTSVGEIARVWKNAIGIVPNFDVPTGATLSVLVDDSFHEFTVGEIRNHDSIVPNGPSGTECGFACVNTCDFRAKMRVFLVGS